MAAYSNNEMADMQMVYGEAAGNGHLSQRIYQDRFPMRRCPYHSTFARIDRCLRETGSFHARNHDRGRNRHVRTPEMEERVLQRFTDLPTTSTRAVAAELGVAHMSVWRVLHSERMHPFHIQKVQALDETDYPRRVEFVRWVLDTTTNDPQFTSNVLFTDEATFTRDGMFNMHNAHIWSPENPHAIVPRNAQRRFSVNIWCGILGDNLVGPYLLPDRLNGATYLGFLRHILPGLLPAAPAGVQRDIWYLHDGAPPHFAVDVRNHLDGVYPARWIGRGGPVAWPARSPDLNPLDFFFWGQMKSLIYETPVESPEDVIARIVTAAAEIQETPAIFERVRQSFLHRCTLCNNVRGRHFEQLL